MPTRLTILGSTGSIGRNALEIVRRYPGRFQVCGLAAHANVDLLSRQIAEFQPHYVAISHPGAAERLEPVAGTTVWTGPGAMERLAAIPVEVCLVAVVGAAGLRPLLAAIETGNRIALANKESLVMAGALVMDRVRARGVDLVPVDSEHNAVFQCLQGNRISDVRCIHLTASGGPFYGWSRDQLRDVTPEQATQHPTWDMGAKISVDSATLMNKGLEIIEAMWLFGVPLSNIEVVIHPQSVVHSLVEFTDGSLLAQLGVTDMKFPILFALTWPERVQSPFQRLDLAKVRDLTFAAPAVREFPCLAYARHAAEQAGVTPAVLNAANEEAVAAFCGRQIPFLAIAEVVGRTLDTAVVGKGDTLEAIEAADAAARNTARAVIRETNRW